MTDETEVGTEAESAELTITEEDFDRLQFIGTQLINSINFLTGDDRITGTVVALQAVYDTLCQLVGTENAEAIIRDVTGIDEETLH